MQPTTKQHKTINWLLLALAVGLRLCNLGAAPLWYDEAFTDLATRLPLREMFQALAGDVHPPAYYVLIWILQRIGIQGAWGLRILSALASIGSVILAGYLAGLITKDNWVETITIGLMAFSPMNLHYSQEARMYALLQLLILVALIAIYKQLWAILTIATAAAMLTHTYGLFYAASLSLVALVIARDKWRKWIPAFGLAGILWLPWAAVMINQMRSMQSAGYWIQPVSMGRVLRALQKTMFSFALPNEMALATMIMLGVGMGILIVTLGRSWQQRRSWISLVIMAGVPLLLAVLASWLYRPVLLYRPLIGSLPMMLILIGIVISVQDKPGKILAAAILIPLMISLATGYHIFNLKNKGDSTHWLDVIRSEWQPGSVVYALNDSSSLAMLHGAPDLDWYKMPDCPDQASLGALTPQTRKALGIRELPSDQLPTRYFTVLSLSPVSPACEVDWGRQAASQDLEIVDIYVSEFVEAGVYLHE